MRVPTQCFIRRRNIYYRSLLGRLWAPTSTSGKAQEDQLHPRNGWRTRCLTGRPFRPGAARCSRGTPGLALLMSDAAGRPRRAGSGAAKGPGALWGGSGDGPPPLALTRATRCLRRRRPAPPRRRGRCALRARPLRSSHSPPPSPSPPPPATRGQEVGGGAAQGRALPARSQPITAFGRGAPAGSSGAPRLRSLLRKCRGSWLAAGPSGAGRGEGRGWPN